MKGLSRRTLLAAPAAAAGAMPLLLGGCGEEDSEPSLETQVGALNDALILEHGTVAAYESAREFVSGPALETFEVFFSQERMHIDALETAIEELGATPVEREPQDAYREELGLDQLGGRDDFLNFAVDLENTALALYGAAAATVTSPEVRRTLFTVLAAEAEHLAIVLGELGEPQVPDAFVFGAQTEVRGL